MGNFELPLRKVRGRGGSFSETGQSAESFCAGWFSECTKTETTALSLETYYFALMVVRGEML